MNLAKVSANGQITVPIEVRKALNIKPGDKVIFYQNAAGQFTIGNASSQAIYKAQEAFSGVAEQLGVADVDAVQDLVDEVRYKR